MEGKCPCGSNKDYKVCCGQYIESGVLAPTAEALMRSRYTAYAVHNVDYVVKTCVRDDEHGVDIEETRKWSEGATWKGLTIVRTEKGQANDTEGVVQFKAMYDMNGHQEIHHEISRFKKENGAWLYLDGELKTETVVRVSPKTGRNDPCPCGSGKKFKQCCG